MTKEWNMLQDDVLLAFLDANANRALERIKSEQLLSVEEAMPLLLKAQFNHIAHLDRSIQSIDLQLGLMKGDIARMATKEDIANMATKEDIANMATKEDIANMATKEDIANMATKEDIANMATKEDIANMATKEDIANMATKEDIANMATKDDVAHMATKEDLCRLVTKDGFEEKFKTVLTTEALKYLATKEDLAVFAAHVNERFERVFHRMNAQIAWMVSTAIAASGLFFGLNRLL